MEAQIEPVTSVPERFEHLAVVEVMGHQAYAGLVTEQSIGGCNFVRVDVPKVGDREAFTKLFGQGSIYCITPMSETAARSAAERLRSRALLAFAPDVQPKLPGYSRDSDLELDHDSECEFA